MKLIPPSVCIPEESIWTMAGYSCTLCPQLKEQRDALVLEVERLNAANTKLRAEVIKLCKEKQEVHDTLDQMAEDEKWNSYRGGLR
jgi:hypothetical protein